MLLFVRMISHHIGKLVSKLNHYEFREPVTGLFNRRSLDIILDRELVWLHIVYQKRIYKCCSLSSY